MGKIELALDHPTDQEKVDDIPTAVQVIENCARREPMEELIIPCFDFPQAELEITAGGAFFDTISGKVIHVPILEMVPVLRKSDLRSAIVKPEIRSHRENTEANWFALNALPEPMSLNVKLVVLTGLRNIKNINLRSQGLL